MPLASRVPTTPLKRTNFTFEPGQAFCHFFFLFRNALPQSHALEHSWFCKHNYCPFHHPYWIMSSPSIIVPGSLIHDSPPALSVDTTPSTGPISPRSTAISLHQALNTNNHEAVDDIAQRLLQTLSKKNDKQQILSHILEQWTSELLELRGRIDSSKPILHCPQGFELNGVNKAIYFASPYKMDTHSRLTGYNASPMGRSPPYQKSTLWIKSPTWETFTQNPLTTMTMKSPSCPLPNWLHNALTGPAAGCSPLFTYSNQHLMWGITAKLYRYRQAHIDIVSAENQIESLKAQVWCCKEVQAGARSRMEMAYVEKKLSSFCTVGAAFGQSSSRPYARQANQPAHVLREEEN